MFKKNINFRLRPAKMSKIQIIGLNAVLKSVLSLLHEKGIVGIHRVDSEKLGVLPGHSLSEFDEVSERLIRLRNIFTRLDNLDIIKKSQLNKANIIHSKDIVSRDDLKAIIRGIDDSNVIVKLEQNIQNLGRLRSEISEVERHLKDVLRLKLFNVDFSNLRTKTLDYIAFLSPDNNKIDALDNLKKILIEKAVSVEELETHDLKLISNEAKNSKTAGLLFLGFKWDTDENTKKKIISTFERILSDNNFTVVNIPQGLSRPKTEIDKLHRQIVNLSGKLRIIIEETEKVAIHNSIHMLKWYHTLEVYAERYSITSNFGFTKDTFILEGWIKKDLVPFLRSDLGKFNDNVVLGIIKPEKGEKPPVYLENPKIVAPFEFITKNYSLPNSEEFDPSLIFFITVPLLYGMIVGDVGYGIISFFIAKYLKKKYRNELIQKFGTLWQIAAIPAVIFGVVFDEWLGMPHLELLEFLHRWGLPFVFEKSFYIGLSRVNNLPTLLLITIIVGVIHLALGFILGAWENWNYHRKHAYGKLAWLMLEVGVILSFLPMAGLPSVLTILGLAVLGLSIIAIGWSEGIAGIVELPGIMGNILSYARIAAVGVAGVVLAELIDKFFLPIPQAGLLVILLIPIFVILHIANGLLSMFEALIQGGRLNIVEFRSKFILGGGTLFKPFTVKEPTSKL